MSYQMSDLLQLVVSEGASDLHIRVGTSPTIRVHGILHIHSEIDHVQDGLQHGTDDPSPARPADNHKKLALASNNRRCHR